MNKRQQLIIVGLVIVAFCVFCSLGWTLLAFLGQNQTTTPKVTSASEFTSTSIPTAICTQPRFGSRLSPDDVDILLDEGEVINAAWEVAVRFDCPNISPERVSFKWYYNGKYLCTRPRISDDCDNSSLTDWKRWPGKFLVTIHSKNFPDNLTSGEYKLVILVDEQEVASGTVSVNP